MREGEKMQVWN